MKHAPTGYPWHAYYGARFAWRDDRAVLFRGVNGPNTQTDAHAAGVARLPRSAARPSGAIVPVHRRAAVRSSGTAPRMVDVILVPEGEQAQAFDLLLALDRD